MLGILSMAMRRFARLFASSSLRRFAAISSVGALALVAGAKDAHASGYLTARYGSDQGTPATPNPYAVYFNPAAMGGTKGTQVVVDISLVLRQASYVRDTTALSPSNPNALQDGSYVASNTGKGTLLNLLALPYIGATTDLGTKSFRLGGAFYIPYGGMAKWDKQTETAGVPGSVNGSQRWHNISGTILAMHSTLAASYTIEPLDLSIGANFSGVFHTVSTVRARNVDDSDNTVDPNGRIAEGRSYLTAQGLNATASGGLYFEPKALHRKLKLGLSYTAPPGFGETRMSGTLTQQLGTSPAGENQNIDFLQSYPDIIRFGAAYRLSQKWEVKGDFEYVRWGLFKKQCVVLSGGNCNVNEDGGPVDDAASKQIVLNLKRDWQDAIGARLGPSYYLNDDVELFGSLGLTTSAVPKSTIDASTIDSFRLYAAIGAKFEVSQHLSLAASYNHIFFMPVNNIGESNFARNKVPSRSPGADGKYSSQIGMLNVNATIKF